MTSLDLGAVGAPDFVARVGETFVVYAADDVSFATDLVDVAGPGLTDPTGRPFAVVFAGGPNPPLPQGIWRLVHASMGELDLFLVPVGPGADGRHRYEAVFG